MRSFLFFILFILLSATLSCRKNHDGNHLNQGEGRDTLRAVTLYGPTSFFMYRGEDMGYDYETLKEFADKENYVLQLTISTSIPEMIHLLKEGNVDLIAYQVPFISEYNKDLVYVGPREVTWQVIVQKKNKHKATDVTELIDKSVIVGKDSKYFYRLENLNEEIGGGIQIEVMEKDSLIEEDYIELVSKGDIQMTVVDSDIAMLNLPYYPDLDFNLKISLEQTSSWVVAKNSPLIEKFNHWEAESETNSMLKSIYKKYFELSKDTEEEVFTELWKGTPGKVSPFDKIFRHYGARDSIDWRLLASIGYNESHFNPEAQSPYGAIGLMQIMPVAAKAVGIPVENLKNPDENVRAAAMVIKQLEKSLRPMVPDSAELMKFVLASYNSGIGHIYDAIALAKKHGLNPAKWTGNVSETSLWKTRPEYYNDPVVKHGYFRGKETVDFVDKVLFVYNEIKNNVE